MFFEIMISLQEIQGRLPRNTTFGLTPTPFNVARIIEVQDDSGTDGAILLLEGGRFIVCDCPHGIPADILLSEGFIDQSLVDLILKEREEMLNAQRRVHGAETEVREAEERLREVEEFALRLTRGTMAEAIAKLQQAVRQAKEAYKNETGEEYGDDSPF